MRKNLNYFVLVILLISSLLVVSAQPMASIDADKTDKSDKAATSVPDISALWKQRYDMPSLDLYYGEGGKDGMPVAPFKFIEKAKGGSSPKFVVEDAAGVRWKAKLGDEAQPETVATRLLWAVGYNSDLTYYFPSVAVNENRDGKEVVVQYMGARMERINKDKNKDKDEFWSWYDNPYVSTREFDGLRVMMMLMNNWDLKKENNEVTTSANGEQKYIVKDLGATFGKTGGVIGRSKNDVKDYAESKFIKKIRPETIDFSFHSRPPFFMIFQPFYYFQRSKMNKVAKNVSRFHAKWIGGELAKLSDQQLLDAFRAANYSPEVAQQYVKVLRSRINELTSL